MNDRKKILDDPGDYTPEQLLSAIQKIRSKDKTTFTDACIHLAREKYNKERCFNEYVNLYESLING